MTELNKKLNQTKITQKIIAEKFKTSEGYVHEILAGKRKGLRGTGLKIKEYVQQLLKDQNK